MKGLAVAAVLAALSATAPARAEEPESIFLHYEAYAAGFPVVSFDFRLDETGTGYSVDGHIRTVGLFRLFYGVDLRAESEGDIAGDGTQPHLHEQVLTTQGRDHRARLEYPGDGTVSAQLAPPDESGRPRPAPQQILDTVDPLSAIVAMGHAAARAGRCDGRFPVFDGRRRYDIILSDEGSERIEGLPAYGYAGMARRCRALAVKIAGFSFDEDYQPRVNKGHVWMATLRPGGLALPVRIDFDGTWGLVEVRVTKIEWSK